MKKCLQVACISGVLLMLTSLAVYAGGLPGQDAQKMPEFGKGKAAESQMTSAEARDLQAQIDQLRKDLEALRKDVIEYRKIHWKKK
ncbi:MAG: hypothetical protein RBU23_11865 [Candidatus Auribacterota bacterium]|jgi:outer membrane murein-binding lipoprotein Lpp|nr:hypothetical protein [Candidatus Auribacterota bacterium]